MQTKGLVVTSIMVGVIVVMLVGGVLATHTAEAKSKSKTVKVKVYITDISKLTHTTLVHVCMRDDDSDCHGEITKNLVKYSGDNRANIGTIKFSKFLLGDVSPCGLLEVDGFEAFNCVYGDLKKAGNGQYKTSISFDDLVKQFFEDSNNS